MAYLVLARKYRPERFADMVGQEHVTRTLTNALNHDRLHHAYLFCGVRGLGKTTAARILAKCLVCEHGPTMDPCNACDQCRAVTEGRSTDVIEIDGASNNSVDDIRSLREKVHYLPQSARRKIYIIDEVHMLTASAFNALLKTLEEPPAHVTFLFATTDPHKVLPTIMSRVSRLDFRPASNDTLIRHMGNITAREGVHVDEGGLRVVARCADGSIRDGLTLLDKVIAFAEDPNAITEAEVQTILGQADRFAVADLIDAVLAGDGELTLQRFAQLCQAAHSLPRLAVAILQHFRDLAVVKSCTDTSALLDASESLRERLTTQAADVELVVLGQLFDRFSHAVDGLEDAKAPRLALEMALLELAQTERLIPIGDLVARLRALGSKGPSGATGPSTPSSGGRPSSTNRGSPRSSTPTRTSAPATAPAPSESISPSTVVPPEASTAPSSPDEPASDADSGMTPAVTTQPSATRHLDESPSDGAPPIVPTDATMMATPRPSTLNDDPAPHPGVTPPPERDSPPSHGPAATIETSAAAPPPAAAELPAPVDSALANQLWEMVNGARREAEALRAESATPNEPEANPASGSAPIASLQSPASTRHPTAVDASANATPAAPPKYVLEAAPSNRVNASTTEATPATDDDESQGCASPRCVPAQRVAWRNMAPLAAWEGFLERVLEEDEILYAVLVDVGFVTLDENKLVLAAPAGCMARQQLAEAELAARFDELVARYLGSRFELGFENRSPALDDAPSVAQLQRRRREEHQAALEHEAKSHPALLALIGHFGGEIRGVSPSTSA